jgi:hypothetical protein
MFPRDILWTKENLGQNQMFLYSKPHQSCLTNVVHCVLHPSYMKFNTDLGTLSRHQKQKRNLSRD